MRELVGPTVDAYGVNGGSERVAKSETVRNSEEIQDEKEDSNSLGSVQEVPPLCWLKQTLDRVLVSDTWSTLIPNAKGFVSRQLRKADHLPIHLQFISQTLQPDLVSLRESLVTGKTLSDIMVDVVQKLMSEPHGQRRFKFLGYIMIVMRSTTISRKKKGRTGYVGDLNWIMSKAFEQSELGFPFTSVVSRLGFSNHITTLIREMISTV
nr:uncharacterized protein LOC109149921 [Ipomoea batatas]